MSRQSSSSRRITELINDLISSTTSTSRKDLEDSSKSIVKDEELVRTIKTNKAITESSKSRELLGIFNYSELETDEINRLNTILKNQKTEFNTMIISSTVSDDKTMEKINCWTCEESGRQ